MRQRRINCLAVDAVSGVAFAASESINFRHAVASTLCSLTSPVTAVNCHQSGLVEWGMGEGYDKRRVVDPRKNRLGHACAMHETLSNYKPVGDWFAR